MVFSTTGGSFLRLFCYEIIHGALLPFLPLRPVRGIISRKFLLHVGQQDLTVQFLQAWFVVSFQNCASQFHSTHGYLKGTKDKTQKVINDEARSNFEYEMEKHKEYFRKFDIFTLIYTDSDLQNINSVFQDIQGF